MAQPTALAVTVTPYAVAGWWTGQGWVLADGSAPVPVQGGESYTVLRPDGTTTTAAGSAPGEGCETDPGTTRVTVPGLDADDWPPAVAVSGVADPRPRPVEVLSRSATVYRQAAADLLAQRGVGDREATVVQVLRTDLDGDGTAEVLVVAERIADRQLYAQVGDYSIVFLRRVVNEVPVTTVLTESIPDPRPDETPFVQSHRVAAIADLNGDGRMEVALAGRYYEGASVAVFELAGDGTTDAVMLGGCGA